MWPHDVRVAQHKATELLGHDSEVCGLKWRPDGELLASGGSDNVVNIWDGRAGGVNREGGWSARPQFAKNNHTAAVKVRFRSFVNRANLLLKTCRGAKPVF